MYKLSFMDNAISIILDCKFLTMVKSKFKTYQFIGQFVMTGVLLFCISLFYPIYFGKHPTKLFSGLWIMGIALTVIIPIYIIGQMKMNYKKISIDTLSKKVSFYMFIFPIVYTYPFDYFDGYVDTITKDKYGSYKCFYFVKNGKLVYKVSEKFYSNVGELHDSINSLKNWGFLKYSPLLSIKIALHQQILTA